METLAVAVATVVGVGRAPIAPGTAGSLVAVPLLPALAGLRADSPAIYAVVLLALFAVAVWSAGVAEEVLGGHDHSRIVIDEVVGQVAAGIFLPGTWTAAILAFFVFRLFDVLKPFPANRIDRVVPGGLGVVGDDLVAGLYAGIVCRLLLELV